MRRITGAAPYDRLELGLLAAFAAVSVWVLGLDLVQMVVHGRVWTGTDGIYITDQMQYLGWIESASHHLLVSNMFVLRHTPADYFQPAVAISGVLVAVGIPASLSLLLWKPVGVLWLFAAVRLFARRALPDAGRAAWLIVIALTLFYGSFSDVYGQLGVVGDLFPGFLSWGYPFALLGIAAAVSALLGYDRARRDGRVAWAPGLLGAFAGLVHPWQGEVLVLTIIIGEVVFGGLRGRRPASARPWWRAAVASPALRLAVVTVAVSAAPLLYYGALDRFDLSWNLGRQASKHAFPAVAIGLALAPLALVALLGYLGRTRDALHAAVRAWPLAVLVVYLQSGSAAGATPLHAFDGITLPLSVLAVDGVLRLRRLGRGHVPTPPLSARLSGAAGRWAVAGAVLVATVPATIYEMENARASVRPVAGNPNFITTDERAALQFLRDDPTPGGVLTRFYLGATVPGRTGRHTYTGDCIWSEPDCKGRSDHSRALLMGELTPVQAAALVRGSGARFVLSDCQDDSDLTQDLQPILVGVHRFGCATVYEVAATVDGSSGGAVASSGALAESARATPVRSSGGQ